MLFSGSLFIYGLGASGFAISLKAGLSPKLLGALLMAVAISMWLFLTQDCRGSSNIEAFEACMKEQRDAFEAKTTEN